MAGRGLAVTETNLIIESFERWKRNAEIGAVFCYTRGNLARDRLGDQQLSRAATEVWKSYLRGECLLTQRKMGDRRFEYLATRVNRKPVEEKVQLSASFERERG